MRESWELQVGDQLRVYTLLRSLYKGGVWNCAKRNFNVPLALVVIRRGEGGRETGGRENKTGNDRNGSRLADKIFIRVSNIRNDISRLPWECLRLQQSVFFIRDRRGLKISRCFFNWTRVTCDFPDEFRPRPSFFSSNLELIYMYIYPWRSEGEEAPRVQWRFRIFRIAWQRSDKVKRCGFPANGRRAGLLPPPFGHWSCPL